MKGVLLIVLVVFLVHAAHSFTVPQHSVIIHGIRFGLLDDTDPTTTEIGCQSSSKSGPTSDSGWALASSTNPIHRMAILSYPWGTSCLVLDGGISLSTSNLQVCSDNALSVSGNSLSVKDCDQRILLYQVEPVDLASEFISCSSFEGDDCDEWKTDGNEDISTTGSLHWESIDGDLGIVYQTIEISDDVNSFLQTGFIFGVSSKCTLDAGVTTSIFYASITLHYGDNENSNYKITFDECTDKYEAKNVAILPSGDITSIEISFYFAATSETIIRWKYLTITSNDNLLTNPSFQSSGFEPLKGWKNAGFGFLPDLPRQDDDDGFTSSILFITSKIEETEYNLRGAFQEITGDGWSKNSIVRSLYIGGWSKTYELTGPNDDNFGINIDIKYDNSNTTGLFGQVLQFPTGTHDWVYSDTVIHLNQPAVSVEFTVLLREHTGAAWADNVILAIIESPEDSYPCNMGAFGDPRFKTVFNEIYSFQTPGEFTLFTSDELEIQSRHVPFRNSGGTLLSAVALKLGNDRISIQYDTSTEGWKKGDIASEPIIYLNGHQTEISESSSIFLEGSGIFTREDYKITTPVVTGDLPTITPSPSPVPSTNDDTPSSSSSPSKSHSPSPSPDGFLNIDPIDTKSAKTLDLEYSFETSIQASLYRLQFEHGEVLIHSRYILDDDTDIGADDIAKKIGGYLQVITYLHSSVCSDSDGLFGNGKKESLTTRSGESIDIEKVSQDDITKTANTWKISESTSLFHYSNGQSSNDFYNEDFSDLDTDSISKDCKYWATVSCNRQALTSLNDSCVEDVLYMNNNPFIIQNYHTIEGQLHLVSKILSEVDFKETLYEAEQNEISTGSGFTLTIIISVSIIGIIGIITVIYRRRKRRKPIVPVDPNNSMTELEDLFSDNDRAEMFN